LHVEILTSTDWDTPGVFYKSVLRILWAAERLVGCGLGTSTGGAELNRRHTVFPSNSRLNSVRGN